MTDQLALFAELVWRRHRRCVGALLLLNPKDRDWTFRIPAQRCGKAASCWSALYRDVPEATDGLLVGGSYQSRVLSPGEDATDAVPPVPGVHLVHVIGDDHSIYTFLRTDDETRNLPAEKVIFDGIELALETCLTRLTFAP